MSHPPAVPELSLFKVTHGSREDVWTLLHHRWFVYVCDAVSTSRTSSRPQLSALMGLARDDGTRVDWLGFRQADLAASQWFLYRRQKEFGLSWLDCWKVLLIPLLMFFVALFVFHVLLCATFFPDSLKGGQVWSRQVKSMTAYPQHGCTWSPWLYPALV